MEIKNIFIGVSAPNVVTPEMVSTMANDAIVFAMANPTPEIMPDLAKQGGARIVATGRSDYPNQINNVLVFPGIFRGALDVRATNITEEMKLAASRAIASLVTDEELLIISDGLISSLNSILKTEYFENIWNSYKAKERKDMESIEIEILKKSRENQRNEANVKQEKLNIEIFELEEKLNFIEECVIEILTKFSNDNESELTLSWSTHNLIKKYIVFLYYRTLLHKTNFDSLKSILTLKNIDILKESLEVWDEGLIYRTAPRIHSIIKEIDFFRRLLKF